MTPADDIKDDEPASLDQEKVKQHEAAKSASRLKAPRQIGPESEVRGGSEAPLD